MDAAEILQPTENQSFGWDFATDYPDIYASDIAPANYRSWRRFLFLMIFMACGFVAGIVSLVSFKDTSALTLNQSLGDLGGNPIGEQNESLSEIKNNTLDLSSGDLSSLTDCRVSAAFPKKVRRWCSIITKYADKRGLPPDLVAAVMLQESGGNPEAFSHSGAVGLMQIMPRDGPASAFMCINGPCFASRPSQDELRDPEFNVSIGTRMLASLVRKHGSLREALKSYGPMDGGYYYADKVMGIYQNYGG